MCLCVRSMSIMFQSCRDIFLSSWAEQALKLFNLSVKVCLFFLGIKKNRLSETPTLLSTHNVCFNRETEDISVKLPFFWCSGRTAFISEIGHRLYQN